MLEKVNKLSVLNLQDNRVEDVSPLTKQTELKLLMIERNQIKDLKPLVEAAKADAAGPKRFAPYLRLYIAGNPLLGRGQVGAARCPQGRRGADRGLIVTPEPTPGTGRSSRFPQPAFEGFVLLAEALDLGDELVELTLGQLELSFGDLEVALEKLTLASRQGPAPRRPTGEPSRWWSWNDSSSAISSGLGGVAVPYLAGCPTLSMGRSSRRWGSAAIAVAPVGPRTRDS